MTRTHRPKTKLARLLAYDDQTPDEDVIEFTLPEDLSALSDEQLSEAREQAREAFDALYGDGSDVDPDVVPTLTELGDAIDAIRAEEDTRHQAREEARTQAAEVAARVRGEEQDDEDGGEDESGSQEDVGEDSAPAPEGEAREEVTPEPEAQDAEPVTASSRGPVNISVSGAARRRRRTAEPSQEDGTPRATLTAAADTPGHSNGAEITFGDAAQAFLDRARGVNQSQYEAAYRGGRRLTQSFGLAVVRKPFPAELTASGSNDEEVLAYAADPSRLPGGSLTAAGWCAPSETIYDLVEEETTDGVFSLPEINVTRGGIRHTLGPDFSSIFTNDDLSFDFSEDEVADGDYDGSGGGTKPFYKVPCPDFVEDRLRVAGVQITAGILQNRAYPETIGRFIRGALVAHEHKMAAKVLAHIAGESTSVSMPADQVGAAAPILTSIELQVEDYRNRHRVARGTQLELVTPYWVRGAIRSDLSRRLGVNLLEVGDGQIANWFQQRGVNPQFVYNYDDLDGTAANRTAWPTEIKYLLYSAGTWVRGGTDVITLESVFDSALFRVNEYTALFTEEGWLVAQRGHDSREVTVPISANGATHGGIAIDHDGSAGA